MDTRPVLFIDSGIGGIPYCRHFHRRNPDQAIVYLADRLHFPYGKWEQKELAAVLIRLVERVVLSINPRIVVVACNTASIAALASLREHFPALCFVGTVPAVKPAALATKTGKIGVLGTELTINQPYNQDLADQHGKKEIVGIAAPELVEFVEEYLDFAIPEEKIEIARYYLNQFRAAGADTVVLGCTHFLFLEDEFRQAAVPDIAIFESVKGISQRIETLLAETVLQEESESVCQNLLLLTGSAEPEPSWAEWARRLGFGLSLLGEE
jgi:glutamate racemase